MKPKRGGKASSKKEESKKSPSRGKGSSSKKPKLDKLDKKFLDYVE